MRLTQDWIDRLDYCQVFLCGVFFLPLFIPSIEIVIAVWLFERHWVITVYSTAKSYFCITSKYFWSTPAIDSVLLVSVSLGFVCLLQLGNDCELWIKPRGKGDRNIYFWQMRKCTLFFMLAYDSVKKVKVSNSRFESDHNFPCIRCISAST